MYKNATTFCMLDLEFATLLICSLVLTDFWGVFRIFYIEDLLSANKDFTSSFPIWMPFIYFALLLWLGLPVPHCIGVFRVVTLFLFLILEERFQLLNSKYYVGCGVLIYGLYCTERCSFYTQFVKHFYHERMLHFIK